MVNFCFWWRKDGCKSLPRRCWIISEKLLKINTRLPPLLVAWARGPGCLSLLSWESSQKPGCIFRSEEGAALKSSTSSKKKGSSIPLSTDQQSSPLSLIRMPGISIISCREWLEEPSVRLSFQRHLFQTSLNGKGTTAGKALTLGKDKWQWTWCPCRVSLQSRLPPWVAESSLCGFASPDGVDISDFLRVWSQMACGEVDPAKKFRIVHLDPLPPAPISRKASGFLRSEKGFSGCHFFSIIWGFLIFKKKLIYFLIEG